MFCLKLPVLVARNMASVYVVVATNTVGNFTQGLFKKSSGSPLQMLKHCHCCSSQLVCYYQHVFLIRFFPNECTLICVFIRFRQAQKCDDWCILKGCFLFVFFTSKIDIKYLPMRASHFELKHTGHNFGFQSILVKPCLIVLKSFQC